MHRGEMFTYTCCVHVGRCKMYCCTRTTIQFKPHRARVCSSLARVGYRTEHSQIIAPSRMTLLTDREIVVNTLIVINRTMIE